MLKRAVVIIAGFTLAGFIAHRSLLDGIDGWLFATLFDDDTEYAQGYSDHAFRQIRDGMTESDVLRLLGKPFSEVWMYPAAGQDEMHVFFNEKGLDLLSSRDAARMSLSDGMTQRGVLSKLGSPTWKSLAYARPAHGGSYRERLVRIRGNAVTGTIHDYYWD